MTRSAASMRGIRPSAPCSWRALISDCSRRSPDRPGHGGQAIKNGGRCPPADEEPVGPHRESSYGIEPVETEAGGKCAPEGRTLPRRRRD